MDTFFARNRLSAYLDGSLSDSESAQIETALAHDQSLRRDYDTMREAVELLRALGPVDAPEGFHARVLAQVQDEPDPGTVVSLWRRTLGRVPVEALALAAAGLLVVVVIQGRNKSPEQDSPPAVAAAVPAPSSAPEISRTTPSTPTPAPTQAEPLKAGDGRLAQAVPAVADGDLRTVSKRTAAKPSGAPSAGTNSADVQQPYIAGWEQAAPQNQATIANQAATDQIDAGGSELGSGIDMEGPRSYRISLADDQLLAKLSAVAERTGGRLTDASGDPLKHLELAPDGKTTWIHMVVPQAAATDVEGYLTGLGGVPTPPPTTQILYGSDFTVFVIQVSGAR